jgi:hypothetical protein
MNRLRFWLATAMWFLQRNWFRFPLWFRRLIGIMPVNSRWLDWLPVRCRACGWTGPLRWTCHTYENAGDDAGEALDRCPRCGSLRLWS